MSNFNFPTELWDSDVLEGLNAHERHLFVYLFTSPLANNLGVFQITERKMTFHTGLSLDELKTTLEGLTKKKRVYFKTGYILMPEKIKQGSMNTNKKLGVINDVRRLPPMLLEEIMKADYSKFINAKKKTVYDDRLYRMIFKRLTGYTETIKKKEKEPEVFIYSDFVSTLADYFPDQHQPKTNKKKFKDWHDTVRLLIETDGFSKQMIESAVRWARSDEDFWKKAFKSFTSIRKPMKNGVRKIDHFMDKVNEEDNGRHLIVPEKENTNDF